MKRSFNTTAFFTGISVIFIAAGLALGNDREDRGHHAVNAQKAKITMEQAMETAKTKFPGRVIESELESEDGGLIYEVKIVSASGDTHEVEIDAQSGKVLKTETEQEGDNEHESEKS